MATIQFGLMLHSWKEGDSGRKAPWKLLWNSLVPPKVSFFCVGSFMGKNSYNGAS